MYDSGWHDSQLGPRGGQVCFIGDNGSDTFTLAVSRHHTMRAFLNETHHQVSTVDRHVLVKRIRLTG